MVFIVTFYVNVRIIQYIKPDIMQYTKQILDFLEKETKGKNKMFGTIDIAKELNLPYNIVYTRLKKLNKNKQIWCGWTTKPHKRLDWSGELTCLYLTSKNYWESGEKEKAIQTLIELNNKDGRIDLTYDDAKTFLENNVTF